MQDHPHGPVVGLGLAGHQHHRAPVLDAIKRVLGRGAEALIEGVVAAGLPPLGTASGFFQLNGGADMLHLVITYELVFGRNVGLLVARTAAPCLVCLVPWGWGCCLGTGRALGGTGGFG